MIYANQVIDTLKKHILVDGFHHVFDFDKSHDSYLIDKATGKEYLDCFGQFGSLALGYNHPKLLAQKEKLIKAALCKIVNSDLYSEEYASFIDTFFTKALPPYFKYFFGIEGGAAAVENALKIAFDYKAKKLGRKITDDPDCNDLNIIHLEHSFHGRIGFSLSLLGTGHIKTSLFPKHNWSRVLAPAMKFPETPENMEYLDKIENESLKQIKKALKNKKRPVAAIILEPLQSEGGNNIFSKNYLETLRLLADEFDALLIFDEIQAGLGASGHWWLHQYYNVKPDLMVTGKKTQICCVLSTDRIDDIEDHCFKQGGRINSTWGGSIVDCVRAEIIINTIVEDNLIENTKNVGEYFIKKLVELEDSISDISNVRGIGTLLAFDLPDTIFRNRILEKLRENMMILPCGDKSIRFRPALTFSKEDADQAIYFIKKSFYEK